MFQLLEDLEVFLGQMGSVEPPTGSGSVLVYPPHRTWLEQLQRKKTSPGQEVPARKRRREQMYFRCARSVGRSMESVRMCESVQMLRCFVSQRLSAAAAEISEMFERTITELERRLHETAAQTHTADVQQLVVTKEEDDPLSLDQDDAPEPPHIKEEQEEVWTSREQLQSLDEADIIKFTFFPVAVKSEEEKQEDEDEEKPQSSQLQQRQIEDMKPEADGEDCGGPEPDRDSDPDHHDETSHSSEPETKAGDDWKKSSGPQSGNRGCDPGEKPFSCSECGKRFSQNSNMKTHMRIHTGEKPFSCSVCGKRFTQKINLTHHIMAAHTGERRYSCSVCGRKFTRRYGLKTHQCVGRQSSQFHRRRTEDEEHLKTFREPDKNLNHDDRMFSEAEVDVSCDSEDSEPQSGLNSPQNNEEPGSDLDCNTVKTSASFEHDGHLQKHDEVQTGGKPFKCSVCGKTYHWKKSLMVHMRLHSEGKRFSCSVCKKTFQWREHVVRHMRVHTGEKPFSCSFCGKTFAQNSSLTKHLRVHTGEKPFSCSVCQKTFQRRETAVIHMRVHTGEKPFSCSVCGARFSFRSNLSQHERMHTGEKPFSCSVCGKRFARKPHLSTHLTVHTGEKPFSCPVCGKTFSQKGNLKQHLFVHSEEKALSHSVNVGESSGSK